MANPQVENGYTRIANELLDAICRLKISGNEFRILLFIIRRTYGFQRKSAEISLSEIAGAVGMSAQNISREIKKLIQYHIIYSEKNSGNIPNTIQLQKDYSKWECIIKNDNSKNRALSNLTILKNDNTSTINSDNTSTIKTDTPTYKEKEKNNKESVCTHMSNHENSVIQISDILKIADQLGFAWDEREAQAFLDYNLDIGRKGGWEYAVKKWEENRKKRCKTGKKPDLTAEEAAEMDEYLALANRFPGL